MARQVFLSFHFDNDAWRASQVRNMGVIEGKSDCRLLMSAIPPKADIDGRSPDVRFVPEADIMQVQQSN